MLDTRTPANTPDTKAIEVAGRLTYAVTALSFTWIAARYGFGMDAAAAKEVSLLNSGVAYYTRDASGRIVVALNRVTEAVRSRRS